MSEREQRKKRSLRGERERFIRRSHEIWLRTRLWQVWKKERRFDKLFPRYIFDNLCRAHDEPRFSIMTPLEKRSAALLSRSTWISFGISGKDSIFQALGRTERVSEKSKFTLDLVDFFSRFHLSNYRGGGRRCVETWILALERDLLA